jgi:peptidoglycan/xylan/chitin deacetylase (PgdA/CDA1 family)
MRISRLLWIGSILFGAAMLAPPSQAGDWPGGRQSAVVLTYDDALSSHLDIALPALDAAGLKGTFFLIGNVLTPEQIGSWRAAAAKGHELGNHTVRHACPQANYPPARKLDTSESYDVEMMLAEIRTMNTMLAAIDGKPQHGFATPCGEHLAGGVDYLPALRTKGLVRYVRSAAWPGGKVLDPMDVPCRFFDEKVTGAEMIAAVESAARTGGLLVLGFHGVGGDYLKVSAEAHAQLLAYLKAHADTIWVAPFSTVMDYVTSRPGNQNDR